MTLHTVCFILGSTDSQTSSAQSKIQHYQQGH